MRAIALLVLALVAVLVRAVSAAPAAQVVETTHVSKVHGAHDLTVILPPGYDPRAARRYPVLYLLDGQNLTHHARYAGGWRAPAALEEASHHGTSMIIVGIHARDRVNEYTPFVDADEGGGKAEALLRYVSDELIPHVEASYNVRRGAAQRAIGGSSLGGLFAMHALATRPDLFSRGLVLSPSVWWADKALLGEVAQASHIASQRVVLYNGGDEDGRADSEALRDLLAHKGAKFGSRLFHWTEPSAGHDEGAWATYLPRGLGLLFPHDRTAP